MKEKSLLGNYAFNLIKTLSSLFFPVITFTYSARILGVEGVGKVNFAKSVITYFSMTALLGMNYYGTREAAKLRDDKRQLSKYVHEMLLINGCTTIMAYLILFISMQTVPKLYDYKSLLIINSFAIALQGMGMEWLYQALEEYKYIAMRSVLFQVISLILMFLFVRRSEDIMIYAFIYMMATSGAYILNFINVRKCIECKWYGNYELKKHIRPLLWLFAMAVSIELYTVLDTTMLGFLQGDEAVGKYVAAVKVNKLTNTVITSVGVILIPRLSYYVGNGEIEKLKTLINKTYNFVFILSIPAAIGLFSLSDSIIRLFSGREFLSAGYTMRLMVPIVLFIPFSIVTNQQTFVPMGKESLILISTSLGAITNFIFNLLLIPRYSENGAAAATVMAEIIVAMVCYLNARHYFNMSVVFGKFYQYWIASIPILIIAKLVEMFSINYIIEMIITVCLSSVSYLFILFILRNNYLLEIFKILQNRVRNNKDESI